ncbi:MAG: hypothetical protein WCS85_04400 [Candidatus Peribacteraceae bacterium]
MSEPRKCQRDGKNPASAGGGQTVVSGEQMTDGVPGGGQIGFDKQTDSWQYMPSPQSQISLHPFRSGPQYPMGQEGTQSDRQVDDSQCIPSVQPQVVPQPARSGPQYSPGQVGSHSGTQALIVWLHCVSSLQEQVVPHSARSSPQYPSGQEGTQSSTQPVPTHCKPSSQPQVVSHPF